MVEYQSLRVPKDVYDRLLEEKRDNETWGGCFTRLMDTWTVRIDEEQAEEIAKKSGKYAGEDVEGRLR